MHLFDEAVALRIFLGENDRWKHEPLDQAIVLKARALELAGATVFRGPVGFGPRQHIHPAKIMELSTDLPVVIEIVDTQEKVDAFRPVLNEMMQGGLVTLETVKVLRDGMRRVVERPNE